MANRKDLNEKTLPYRFVGSLALLAIVPLILLAARVLHSESLRFVFLFWNLFLASVPAMLAWWLSWRVEKYGWLKWQQIVLSLVWLAFLPNSFYLLTDFIHLRSNFEADLLFDITMLMSFVVAGFAFGYTSVYLVHQQLRHRLSGVRSYGVIALVFVLVSFAVCLGRYTRWNSWDILLQPAGLLFDVSDRLLNPAVHAQTSYTTISLFMLLFPAYVVIWEAAGQTSRSE